MLVRTTDENLKFRIQGNIVDNKKMIPVTLTHDIIMKIKNGVLTTVEPVKKNKIGDNKNGKS